MQPRTKDDVAKSKFCHGKSGAGKDSGGGECYGLVEGFHHEWSSWEGAELGPSLSIETVLDWNLGFPSPYLSVYCVSGC